MKRGRTDDDENAALATASQLRERTTHDDETAALAQSSQLRIRGWELKNKGLYGQARDAFSGAVDASSGFQSTTAKRALANSLRARADVHDRLSNYGHAKRDLDRAFMLLDDPDLAACAGIERLRSMCLTSRGNSYLVEDSEHYDPDRALHEYTETLAIAVKDQAGLIPAPHNVPQALRCGTFDPLICKSNMAMALSHLARWEEAEALWKEVINNGASKQAMSSHFNWARACTGRHQWEQAVGHWREALTLSRALGCMDHEASALASLTYAEQLIPTLSDDAGPGAAARHGELLVVLERMGRTVDEQCGICCEDLDTQPQFISPFAPDAGLQTAVAPAVMNSCFHMFHIACIRKFRAVEARRSRFAKCPICRTLT